LFLRRPGEEGKGGCTPDPSMPTEVKKIFVWNNIINTHLSGSEHLTFQNFLTLSYPK
jgi:hypothetical protein